MAASAEKHSWSTCSGCSNGWRARSRPFQWENLGYTRYCFSLDFPTISAVWARWLAVSVWMALAQTARGCSEACPKGSCDLIPSGENSFFCFITKDSNSYPCKSLSTSFVLRFHESISQGSVFSTRTESWKKKKLPPSVHRVPCPPHWTRVISFLQTHVIIQVAL